MERVAATTPLTPTVFVETFPTNFLETVNCAMLRRGQKLSVDPVSLPPGKTWNIGSAETLSSTQGERRIMLQTRLYQCTVDAIQAFDITLPQLGVGSAAYNSALTKLKMAREGTNWPSTPGWLAMTLVKYHQGVRTVLFYTAGPDLYVLGDDSYPWTYPENAIYLLNQILTIFTQNHIPSPLSADLQAFVTQTLSMAGHSTNSKEFLSNQSVYFSGPLTDSAKIVELELNDQYHADAGAALVCLYATAEASCAGVPADQRVACIFNNGIAAGCRDPREIRALEHALEIANAEIDQLPTIAPATRGVHPSLTFADVCVSVQRANYAHHAWMALARDGGHTLDGFHNSWMASLAHAQIHVERTLGMKMPPLILADQINPLNPTVNVYQAGFRDPYEIRSYVYAIVPGVVDGVCDPYWLPQ